MTINRSETKRLECLITIIQRADKNGRRLGFYEPDKDESI